MKMQNTYEEDILKIYGDIGIGILNENGRAVCRREKCNECRCRDAGLSKPTTLWQVGDAYFDSKYRVLFVGKVARGNPGDACTLSDGGSILNAYGDRYKDEAWHFWRYMRDFSLQLYGENGWEYIAISNMVKCNSSNGADTTPKRRKDNCVEIIKAEIDYLKPKNIIFLTTWDYDKQIEAIFPNIILTVADKNTRVNVGKQDMPLWNFTAELNSQSVNVIRVGHPQGKNKQLFIKAIIERLK